MKKICTAVFGCPCLILPMALAVLFCFSPLCVHGDYAQRPPINVNLIIDGSQSFSDKKEEITSWVCDRLDQILAEGDNVAVWSAGSAARVIFSGSINSSADMDALKRSIRELSVSGDKADFNSALTEAARRQSSGYSYTLLVCSSHEALSSVLSQSSLLRYSRIEEFSSWRALIVGLNIDATVKRAAAAFLGS